MTELAAPGLPAEPHVAPGAMEYNKLVAGGFSASEANAWHDQRTNQLIAGGFTTREIEDYWGSGLRTAPSSQPGFDANLMRNLPVVDRPGFFENIAAGWNMSVAGLIASGKAPAENTAPQGVKGLTGYGLGQLAGDIVPAIAGFVGGAPAGAAAGAAVPGLGETGISEAVGGVLGAGAGSAALPEAMRQTLIAAYRRGEVHSFSEWTQVLARGTGETLKAAGAGAVGNLVGGAVGGKVISAGGGKVAGAVANTTTNAAASTAAIGAMNGHVPDADDFISGAVIALGAHAGGTVAGKFTPSEAGRRVQKNLQDIYAETGITPWEATQRAQTDPTFRQRVLAQDVNGDPVVGTERRAQPEPFQDPTVLRNVTPGARPDPMPQRAPVPAVGHIENFMKVMGQVEHGKLDPHDDVVVSPAGAIGRFQIMPGTARQYGFDPAKLKDPAYNTQVARTIAADLYRRYHGDEEAMLVAYNAGPGRGNRFITAGPGTRLVAIPDKSMRAGVRYESEAAARDESFLPHETQKYLANARRHSGNELPGSRGGASSGKQLALEDQRGAAAGGDDENGSRYQLPDWATPQAEAGGGGGGEPPKPPALPPEPPSFDNASADDLYAAIRKNIGEDKQSENLLDPSRNLRQWFSELEPARRIDQALLDEGLGYSRSSDLLAEDMFRQTYASDARAGAFVRFGAIDPISLDMKEGSSSVMDAVKAVRQDGGNLADWTAWMVANRAVEKTAQGMDTGFDTDAAAALRHRPAEIAKYQRGTSIFNNVMTSVLEYGHGSGIFSEAQVERMVADNPTYISFRRVMGDEGQLMGKGRNFRVSAALKKMEGSDRQIVDPMLATLDNMRLVVKMADRNRAIGHIIGMVEGGHLKGLGFKQLEVLDTTKEAGSALEPYTGVKEKPEAADTYAPLLAQRAKGQLPKDRFIYYRDGKAEIWQAKDEAVAELMKGADTPGQANIVGKVAETLASVQRTGIVSMPDFATRNIMVDQITSFIADPLHPPPFITWVRGAMHAFGNDAVYQDWVAKGGAGVALVEMDAKYLARDMHKVFSETGTWEGMWNTVKHPLELAQIVTERLDAASRIGYKAHAESKGRNPIKAATMSRKAYLDFAEKGTLALAQTWARWVPFMRPGFLGLKQMGEAFAERPMTTALYSTLGITVPAVMLYALNYLQDESGLISEERKYRNLPRWERDMMFVTPEINGVRFRMRMPHIIGTPMGGMVNRFLDHFLQKDPHAFDKWAKNIVSDFVPPVAPTWALAPVEHMANHSFFTGKPLIPASLADASGYMQYTDNTTETAKALSRVIAPRVGAGLADVSPIVIENYAREWTGTIGMAALKALDIPFKDNKKPWELADIPFIQGFVLRSPGMSAEPIQNFYDQYGEFKEAKANFGLAKRRGDFSEIELAAADPAAFANLQNIADTLNLQHGVIRGVVADKDMSTAEKRQFIEQVYSDMIEVAKTGAQIMAAVRQAAEDADIPAEAALPDPTAVQTTREPAAHLDTMLPPPGKPVGLPALPEAAPGSPNIGEPLQVLTAQGNL